MSKAINHHQASSEVVPQPKNYITRPGFEALQKRLLQLIDHERPEVVKIVSWAASNGDRSENGDYIYGKKRLREIDKQIYRLTKRLEMAVIIEPENQADKERIYFGATVVYEDDAGIERQIRIVGEDEADPTNGMISWVSPLARALLKRQIGDLVKVPTPNGESEVEVLDILY